MTLEERVRSELLAVRKTTDGLTLATMAGCPTICGLLGGGDPGLAYNSLKTSLLAESWPLTITAAISSLGFTSDKRTHLGRLDDFGAEYTYDQRHARRYSDRGIRELAVLIATRWADREVPELSLTVLRAGARSLELHIIAQHLTVIEMRPIALTVRVGDAVSDQRLAFRTAESGAYVVQHSIEPVSLQLDGEPTSVTIVWAGELWPAFTVTGGPMVDVLSMTTLGTKMKLRL